MHAAEKNEPRGATWERCIVFRQSIAYLGFVLTIIIGYLVVIFIVIISFAADEYIIM